MCIRDAYILIFKNEQIAETSLREVVTFSGDGLHTVL